LSQYKAVLGQVLKPVTAYFNVAIVWVIDFEEAKPLLYGRAPHNIPFIELPIQVFLSLSSSRLYNKYIKLLRQSQ
jgi:hypothetical protein